jgi:hypothetical protein
VVPACSHKVSRVSCYSGYCQLIRLFAYGVFTLFDMLFQNISAKSYEYHIQSEPQRTRSFGLASYPFARRYSGNRCFFLFLRVLRCFSSPSSPCMAIYSPCSDWALPSRVSPFGNLWINGYLRLPKAFRSLSRPSSAPSAKASTLCSY